MVGDVDGERRDFGDVAADELLQHSRQIFVLGRSQHLEQFHDEQTHVRWQDGVGCSRKIPLSSAGPGHEKKLEICGRTFLLLRQHHLKGDSSFYFDGQFLVVQQTLVAIPRLRSKLERERTA